MLVFKYFGSYRTSISNKSNIVSENMFPKLFYQLSSNPQKPHFMNHFVFLPLRFIPNNINYSNNKTQKTYQQIIATKYLQQSIKIPFLKKVHDSEFT